MVKAKKAKPAVAKKSSAKVRKSHARAGIAYRTLVHPLVTEKATMLAEKNQYVFQVQTQATKAEIKQAIFEVYGIKPIKINTCNFSGKSVRYGRVQGTTKSWKKAVITVPEGEKIQVFEGV